MKISEDIKEYLDYCADKELNQRTIKAYNIDLKLFAEYMGNKYSGNKLAEYVESIKKTGAAATAKRKIATLKMFYKYLYATGKIKKNPMDKIDLTVPKSETNPDAPIDTEIIDKLVKNVYESLEKSSSEYQKGIASRNVALVELILNTGARLTEISDLTKEDIDLENGIVKFNGKGYKGRAIKIESEAALTALRNYYIIYEEKINACGYFFVTKAGKKMSDTDIYQTIKETAGESGVTPKRLRQTFATVLYEKGTNIGYIQQVMGHSTVELTERYAKNQRKAVLPVLAVKGMTHK